MCVCVTTIALYKASYLLTLFFNQCLDFLAFCFVVNLEYSWKDCPNNNKKPHKFMSGSVLIFFF